MITCQSCGHHVQVDLATEITADWNYRTQCECCGQEQYGVMYFGAFYQTPQNIPRTEPA